MLKEELEVSVVACLCTRYGELEEVGCLLDGL